MANPEKPIHLPNYHIQDKNVNKAPEFNHNIMGSSAGAGSGEFHLYRKMRRKEMERQQVLQFRKHRDEADEAFHEKLEENAKEADDKTAKKRLKRQKEKERKKQKKKKGLVKKESDSEESSEDDEDKEKEKESE